MVVVAESLAGIVAVLSFLMALLSRFKKVWTENAKQTWLLGEISQKLTDHIEIAHKDQNRRLAALERRRRNP